MPLLATDHPVLVATISAGGLIIVAIVQSFRGFSKSDSNQDEIRARLDSIEKRLADVNERLDHVGGE